MLQLCSVVHVREPPLNVRRISVCVLYSDSWVWTDWISPLSLGFHFSPCCIRFLMSSLESKCFAFKSNAVPQHGVHHSNPGTTGAFSRTSLVSYPLLPYEWWHSPISHPQKWETAFKYSSGATEKHLYYQTLGDLQVWVQTMRQLSVAGNQGSRKNRGSCQTHCRSSLSVSEIMYVEEGR